MRLLNLCAFGRFRSCLNRAHSSRSGILDLGPIRPFRVATSTFAARRSSPPQRSIRSGLKRFKNAVKETKRKIGTVSVLPMEYRCRGHGEKWHFCQNCPRWPIKSFDFDVVVLPWFPTGFELCEQCVAIHERGDCECSEGA